MTEDHEDSFEIEALEQELSDLEDDIAEVEYALNDGPEDEILQREYRRLEREIHTTARELRKLKEI